MAAPPTTTLRCPACGQALRAVLAPGPATQWFPCPHCHAPVPAVVPRDPPPLYTWEVVPGLYPMLPRPSPRRWRARRVVAATLLVVVALSLVFAGFLAYEGFRAAVPGRYTVSGTVFEKSSIGVTPASGARVLLTENGGQETALFTGYSGTFEFTGVPTGGVTLNVSLLGYEPVTIDTFVSAVYDAGTQGISVTLTPGNVGAGSTVQFSEFPDLETFLASIGGAVVLLGLVATIAAIAAVVTFRQDRPPIGIVGGGAGVLAPFSLYLLGLGSAFPTAVATTAVLAAFGAFALALRAVEQAQTGGAPESG